MKYGDVDVYDPANYMLAGTKPLTNYCMRDTHICIGIGR